MLTISMFVLFSPPLLASLQITLHCKAHAQKIFYACRGSRFLSKQAHTLVFSMIITRSFALSLPASRESALPYDSDSAPAPCALQRSADIPFWEFGRRRISHTRCTPPLPASWRARSGCRQKLSAALSAR